MSAELRGERFHRKVQKGIVNHIGHREVLSGNFCMLPFGIRSSPKIDLENM